VAGSFAHLILAERRPADRCPERVVQTIEADAQRHLDTMHHRAWAEREDVAKLVA